MYTGKGANFSQIRLILEDFRHFEHKYKNLKAIVISMGINSRTWTRSNTVVEHNKLLKDMATYSTPCFLLGVSPPPTLSEAEAQERDTAC